MKPSPTRRRQTGVGNPRAHRTRRGRGTRLANGKDNCLVLDFAGNVKRHGPIDLVKPKRPGSGDGDAPVKLCPDCDSIVAAAALECPDCGYIFPARKVQLAPTASTLAVLSSGKPTRPEWLQVSNVTYQRHEKPGGRPSLKVKSFVDYFALAFSQDPDIAQMLAAQD